MQDYLNMISHGHREKLLSLARKKDLNPDQAMESIVQYIRNESLNSNGPKCLKGFITASQIERMIDTIVLCN